MLMEIFFFPYFVLGILHVTNAGFISGNNCGTLTKITKIWQMPTLQEEIDKLNCVIVQHEESFRGYQRKRMENTGYWRDHGPWSTCSVTCGKGQRHRQRKCKVSNVVVDPSKCSPGNETELINCYGPSCIVDGAWSRWSKWGSCIGPCGSSAGIKNRTRTCDNPSPLNDGNDCIGSGIQHSNCNTELCPRDGGWSQWSEWVGCTATCYGNGGIHTRKRYCTDPLPLRGGDECSTGESQEWEACGQYLCPVWTTDTRLGYANFHYSAPDYLHTNECDVHPAETNAKLPANYILGALGNNPQLSVAMDFGFDVTINGVYLKNSQNSFARNHATDAFIMETSADGQSWTTVVTGNLFDSIATGVNCADIPTQHFAFTQVSAVRHIRFTALSYRVHGAGLHHMSFTFEKDNSTFNSAPKRKCMADDKCPRLIEATMYGTNLYPEGLILDPRNAFKDECRDHILYSNTYPYPLWFGPTYNTPQAHMTLDLGAVVTVNGITLRNNNNGQINNGAINGFNVDLSNDLANWNTAFSGSLTNAMGTGVCNAQLESFTFSADGRYVKFVVTSVFGEVANLDYINLDYIQPENAFACPEHACPNIIDSNKYETNIFFGPEDVLRDDCELDSLAFTVPYNYYMGPNHNIPKGYITFDFEKLILMKSVDIKNIHNVAIGGRRTEQFSLKVSKNHINWFIGATGSLFDTLSPTLATCNTVPLETFNIFGSDGFEGRYAKITIETVCSGCAGGGFQYVHINYEPIA